MTDAGFLAGIDAGRSFAEDALGLLGLPVRPSPTLPAPFGALDGLALAGPEGSHPLARIRFADLVDQASDELDGGIAIDGPTRVGEGISGRLRVTARRRIEGRSAALRLVGVRLAERSASMTRQVGTGDAARTETWSWMEVHGSELEALVFPDIALPATIEAGETVERTFTVPAPRLGPPSAHGGVAGIAWAIEARWDIPMGADIRIAAPVEVRQHPDLLRAGVIRLPEFTLFDVVEVEGATLAVEPVPPLAAGTPFAFLVHWPGAPEGRSARFELITDVRGAASMSRVIAAASGPVDAVAGARVEMRLPADAPPTLATEGLEIGWRLRATIDRTLRTDEHRERPVGVW